MTVETVTYISDLDKSYPAENEIGTLHEGNDHLRNIKKALENTFPNVTGAVTATHERINAVSAITDDELAYLQGFTTTGETPTVGTQQASKVVTADADNVVTVPNGGAVDFASGSELRLEGTAITATAAELNGLVANAHYLSQGNAIYLADTPVSSKSIITLPSADIKRVTVTLMNVSLTGTNAIGLQCNDSSGNAVSVVWNRMSINASGSASYTEGTNQYYNLANPTAAGDTFSGTIVLTKHAALGDPELEYDVWSITSTMRRISSGTNAVHTGIGTFSVPIDTKYFKNLNVIADGSNTFDSGTANVIYE